MTYYDRGGKAIDLWTFAQLCEDLEYRQIKVTEFPDIGVSLSTVWLGIDHSFGDGEPQIFETMLFTKTDCLMIGRYATEKDAIFTHDLFLNMTEGRIPNKQDVERLIGG